MKLELNWSEPKLIDTRAGQRILKKAPPNETFWEAWKNDKEAVKKAGYSVGKHEGNWEVCHWAKPGEGEAPKPQATEQDLSASSATTSSLVVPAPEGLSYMPFQLAAIEYAAKRKGTLLGLEQGLGKTVVSVGVANLDPEIRRVLVVCPASLKLNWRNEFRRWLVREHECIVVPDGKTWPEPVNRAGTVVTIINYDLLVKHHAKLTATEWDLMILDEVQAIKNGQAKRTKSIVGHGRGKNQVKGIPAKKTLALSGTPIPNRPIEIYNVAHLLDPYTFPNYYAFGNRYCDGKPGWGGSRDFSGSSNLGELQSKLRKSCMYRVLKEQVLDDLPDKTHQIIELPPTEDLKRELDEEKRAYRLHSETREKLKKLRESAPEAGDKEKHAAEVERLADGLAVAFAEMSKVRAKIAELKAPFVIDHLLALLEAEPDRKLVVFCWHKSLLGSVLESLAQAKIKAVSIHGGTPMEERQKAVDDFQHGDAMVFVGNIIAAGTGITLTASSTCVFLEQDWTPGNLSQASDRCHRIGQKHNVLIQYLIMENSLDSTMAKRIGEKQSNIDQALDATPEPETEPETELELDLKIPKPKREPKPITLDQRDAARQALQHIVKLDSDRASVVNGVGFSKYDGVSGHRLAKQQHWSDREAAFAVSLARKYRRQLPDHLVSAL